MRIALTIRGVFRGTQSRKIIRGMGQHIEPDAVQGCPPERSLSGAPGSGWIPVISDEWLSFVKIPHKGVTQLSAAVDPSDLVAIHAGDAIRVELEIKDDIRGDADTWKANLIEAIQSSGYRPDNGAEAILKADVVRAAERTNHFINFGTGSSESVTYRPFGYSLTLVIPSSL
jgi:hypothetical protein